MANRAIAVASAVGADVDLRLAQSILERFLNGRHDKPQAVWSAQKILNGIGVRTHQFAERTNVTVPDLCNAFVGRLTVVKAGPSLDYVAPLAQLLAYYPVEASATVLRSLRVGDPMAADKCSEALTYIIANADPVMQRDAARVRSFLLLDQADLKRMRRAFRELVLVPATAGPGEFRVLLDVVRDQLLRLTDQGSEILDNQPTPTDVEVNLAQAGLLQRLRGTPFVNDSRTFGRFRVLGCSVVLLLGLLVPVALLTLLIERWVPRVQCVR